MDECKLSLESKDIAAEKREELLRLFPEAQSEGGKIDFDQLKRALGESVDPGRERYGMNWPGKADCFRLIQSPSTATLLPVRAESVRFDETENMIIEGDNLEVLKLLQKGYQNKIKMIYIDPPYNTGNDFIYPDDFSDNLKNYLQYTGQVDAEGKRFTNNLETDGRFHSNWLNMMYPRLYLARTLLREDGILIASIDDGEQEHLRLLLNAIFGEENFIGTFVINATPNARDYGHIAKMHEYAHFYCRNREFTVTNQLEVKEKKFRFADSKSGFNIHPLYNSNEAFTSSNRPNLYFPIYIYPSDVLADCTTTSTGLQASGFFRIGFEKRPGAVEVYPPKSERNSIQFVWRWGKPKCAENFNTEIIGYKTDTNDLRIVQKMRHTEKLVRSIFDSVEFSSRRGTAEVEDIFGAKIASFPKPVGLIRTFIQVGSSKDDIILDFFAGSGTTAQASLELNEEDGGSRRFILVQLPEPIERSDLKTLADLTKERVRRVIQQQDKSAEERLDLSADGKQRKSGGFRVFKLARSNFKTWEAHTDEGVESIEHQMELAVNHIMPDRSAEDLLYEILMKSEYPLTANVKCFDAAGIAAFSVEDDALIVCVERTVTAEAVAAIAKRSPSKVILLDEAFSGNDQLKANAKMNFESAGVKRFETV